MLFWKSEVCVICVLIAAVCIPIQVVELGEEIDWREYLLPKQIAEYGAGKGTLLKGLYWGIAHLPLIYLGFNYSPENAGALWSNMLMMMLVCDNGNYMFLRHGAQQQCHVSCNYSWSSQCHRRNPRFHFRFGGEWAIRTQSDRANQYAGTDTMCNYHTEKLSTLLSEMQARKFD